MNRILLVEDNIKLRNLIKEYLTRHGYAIHEEERGDKAVYRILHENYFLVILDLNLPGLDGLEVCKLVRKNFTGFILMLTAREADEDHITGLEFGADDYINKPIHPKVLLARIKRLSQRESHAFVMNKLIFGQLEIDLTMQEVRLKKQIIKLKPSEFDLLALLATHAGSILTRDTIMLALRGIDYNGVDRTIDLRISYLREKLNDNIETPFRIKTVRRKGYVFIPDAWE